MGKTANRIVKNTSFLYLKMGITMFISLYTTRLVLNSLGASDFGIFNIVGGAIAMLGFINGSMAAATQRFMSYAEGEGIMDNKKQIFNVSIILHIFIAIIVGLLLFLFMFFLFNGLLSIPNERVFAAKIVYLSLILSVIFTILNVPYDATLNAHENMKYFALIGILEALLKLAVAEYVVYTQYDKLVIYGIMMAFIPVISMTIMGVYCRKHYNECIFAPSKYWNQTLLLKMTLFAGWNMLNSSMMIISNYGIGIVLNHFYGTIANAAQGIANQVSGQLGVLGTSITKSINPVIAKSAGSSDYDKMIQASVTGTKITFFITTIMFIPVLVDSNYILGEWLVNPPKNANIFCVLLLVGNIFQNITLFVPQAISAMGDIKSYSFFSSIASLVPIVLTTLLFLFGAPPYYMYVSIIISVIMKNIIDIYFGKIKCRLKIGFYLKDVVIRLLLCVIAASLIGLGIREMLPESFSRFAIIAMLCSLSYIGMFYWFSLRLSERRIVVDVIKSFLNKITQ